MDQYLLQILKDTNTIIIPGLGALTITNATTGEIMFMPYLKHDDGKLSSHIAEKEGIEENEAKNIVAKHVREIQTSLDKGDSYDMFQFGTFTKGSDGDIEFQNWSSDKKSEAPKAAPKKEKPVEEKKAEPKKEAKKETPKPKAAKVEKPKAEAKPKAEPKKPAPKKEEKSASAKASSDTQKAPVKPIAVVKPEVPKKEEAKVPTKEPKKETPKAETTPKPEKKVEAPVDKKVAPVAAKTVVPPAPKKEMNIAEKEEFSKSVNKLDKLKKDKADGEKKKKRGVGFYMLMVFVLLIVAGGTYFAIDYDNLKQHVPFLADTEVKKEEPKELDKLKENIGDEEEDDSEVIEELVDEEPVDEEVVEPEVVEEPEPVVAINTSNDKPFHIIAGAFTSADNAARLVEKIKAMGYPAKVIVRGSQNVVSVQSYNSKAEAQAAISSVQDAAPKGWVLEWR